MDFETLARSLTHETYENLKRAVELGKWPNGERLSDEQRALCLEAIITWSERNLPPEQRIGFIDRTKPDGTQHGSDPLEKLGQPDPNLIIKH
ncbi:YeaC family protein [Pokkaliibacter sp. CJK22405]|uniref:YeaC family protein n=1 Tax=Pokkaliibacter sp. CJK22405 TaxID=3384615 RepID=UPI003985258B